MRKIVQFFSFKKFGVLTSMVPFRSFRNGFNIRRRIYVSLLSRLYLYDVNGVQLCESEDLRRKSKFLNERKLPKQSLGPS